MSNIMSLLEDAMRPAKCVAFTYDPDLLNDSPWSITVLLDAGRVRDRWLTKEPFPQPCHGLSQDTVDLKGYAHAAVC